MKVLFFCPFDNSFMSQWQRFQIFDELQHYGIMIEVFNPWSYQSYEEANEALLKKLKEDVSIDLFMNCASSEMLFEETMLAVTSLSIPKLLICYDNLHAPYMHKRIAPLFDLVWLTSWETEPMFKNWGCKTVFLPYASNPFAFRDMYNKSINKVCFVGTPYGTRTMMFNNLLDGSVDVDVFCKSIKESTSYEKKMESIPRSKETKLNSIRNLISFPLGRKVIYSGIKKQLIKPRPLVESHHLALLNKLSNEDMNRAYSNYALSLNVIALRNTAVLKHPVQKLHLRTFEIPMCAGLEMVESNDELRGYFSEGEMVFYHDKEEMIDKAKFYTNPNNESVVRKMKINARRRAANEHGWMNRFSIAFDLLGLTYNKTPDISL